MRYAVVMAGGSGTRLWPLSRAKRPKQVLSLLDGQSLLGLAVERLSGMFPAENIYIITNAQYAADIAGALPHLPPGNIIAEPQGRDTANAIALGAEILAARDDDATMAVFSADHVIRPREAFVECVEAACDAAEEHRDALVTFGIRPTWPHTGLGYVHCGGESDGVYDVLAFKEKPNHHTARRYVESGQYYWNSGMFVWKVDAIRGEIGRLLPASLEALEPIGQAVRDGTDFTDILADIYPRLDKISIDYAVMERAAKVLMIELKCEWLDVGSWPALSDVLPPDESGNVTVADSAVILDSARNVIVAEDDHLLAVLGMDDCVIVHSPDATLVCNKSDSQRLKELVAMLRSKYGEKYL